MNKISPIVLHVPHSSRKIPSDIRPTILLPDADLVKELNQITDAYTDELFVSDTLNSQAVVFPVSRLVVDPERFLDDDEEPMAEKGMGVVYKNTTNMRRLRSDISNKEKDSLIEIYYKPHHVKISSAVNDSLAAHGKCLIIDCHSFPSSPLPYEFNQNPDRPDICIGTDEFHTPFWLSDYLEKSFLSNNWRVEFNRPFSGSFVPLGHYQENPSVWSVMIEVNRSLYMDESSVERLLQFKQVQAIIQVTIDTLINTVINRYLN